MPAPRYACFAVAAPGLAPLVATELAALGLQAGPAEAGGIPFEADAGGLARANLWLRCASRVLIRLAEFPARAFYELERKGRRVPWGDILPPGGAARFRVTSRKSRLYHLDGIAERLLGVSGAATREGPGEIVEDEESGEPADQPQLFVVRVLRDMVSISADSSGALLHRRGYREAGGKAPLRETLAAALLTGAGYAGDVPLWDPFCGSGTIPIEAALIARRMAPGRNRRFAFESWPSVESAETAAARAEARAMERAAAPQPIGGSDRDAGAVTAAAANAGRAGVADDVVFQVAPISAMAPLPRPGLVATNPPYGVRVGDSKDLRDLYAALGTVLRVRCPGSRLAMLSADPALERQVGLPFEGRWRSSNGGLPVELVLAGIPA